MKITTILQYYTGDSCQICYYIIKAIRGLGRYKLYLRVYYINDLYLFIQGGFPYFKDLKVLRYCLHYINYCYVILQDIRHVSRNEVMLLCQLIYVTNKITDTLCCDTNNIYSQYMILYCQLDNISNLGSRVNSSITCHWYVIMTKMTILAILAILAHFLSHNIDPLLHNCFICRGKY